LLINFSFFATFLKACDIYEQVSNLLTKIILTFSINTLAMESTGNGLSCIWKISPFGSYTWTLEWRQARQFYTCFMYTKQSSK